ncbi:hypothetical protein [Nitrosopumilus sp.]|uniref:hypothetical protein n=1 Tax=Nitrosopumilus sp. TaxID=2024843 RepID=UPI003D0F7E06
MKIIFILIFFLSLFLGNVDVFAQEVNDYSSILETKNLLDTYDSMFDIHISATLAGLSLTAGAFLMSGLFGIRQPSTDLLKKYFESDVTNFESFYQKMNEGPKFFIIAFVFFLINLVTLVTVFDSLVDSSINLEIEKMIEANVESIDIFNISIIQKTFSILGEGIPFGLGLYFLLKGGKRILDFYTKMKN